MESIEQLQEQIKALQKSNVLWGKKWVACGDSLTHGDFSGWKDENGLEKKESQVIYDKDWEMYKTYPWWIGKRNHMTIINEAKNGSTMALTKQYLSKEDGKDIDYRHPFSYKRYQEIPEDADYCTISFVGNDSACTELGTVDDTTNETFYGAWNMVLEWLLVNRPFVKFGIILMSSGKYEYREAVRVCAQKWGVPYLDIAKDCNAPIFRFREEELNLCERAKEIYSERYIVCPENRHPNETAHERLSYYIEQFLRGL